MIPAREKRPLRILHVIGGLELGGAETLLYRLATHQIPGVEQQVVCLGRPGWYSARLEEHGVPVHHLDVTSSLGAIPALLKLDAIIRDRADVVQSWMYFANLLSGLAARRVRKPVVWSIHNASFERVGIGSRLSALAGGAGARRLTRHVINCSQHSSAVHAKLGYSRTANSVIANGYDDAVFRPDEARCLATRRSLGLADGTFVVGAIARWHPDKDIPNLLAAVRGAADQGVPVHCLLVGRGLEDANFELATVLRASGCEDLVTPLGSRDDIPDLARSIDLHVLPSRSEAFPNVVAETMLSGTPNVVTDVGDAADMVGDTGWVVPAGNSADLASAIVAAWREHSQAPDLWSERRRNARSRIAERFTFAAMAEAYARVWREVADRA